MIDISSAAKLAQTNLPGSKIQKSVEYKDLYVFLVSLDDPDEQAVFFSVNKNTNEFSDFSPFYDADTVEFEKLMLT